GDFLTVHTPLTAETQSLIAARELALMKKGARIINCARGGIIHEDALAEALRSGHIAGAALDVFVQEPPPADHPLVKLPNVVLTPHLGASTVEAQTSVALEAAQLLIDFLTRGLVQFAVNMAAVDRTELEELRLYVDMARRLGLLHAQMSQGAIQRAELSYRGEVARRSTRLVTAAFAAGLLEYRLDTYMDGVMLIFTHRDVPGLIGYIGTIFGKHQVNIAQMTVGRQVAGGEAIAVLNLDSLPPEEAIREVRTHPQISSLSVVKLPPAGAMPAWFG